MKQNREKTLKQEGKDSHISRRSSSKKRERKKKERGERVGEVKRSEPKRREGPRNPFPSLLGKIYLSPQRKGASGGGVTNLMI